MQKYPKNFGVLLGTRPTDFLFSGVNGVPKKTLFPDGNSIPYFSPGHLQKKGKLETLSCVSESGTNIEEAIMNRQIELGMISKENLKWLANNEYLDENGKMKISPRFTAKKSGTGKSGNYQFRVHDSLRNDGVVPEVLWPFIEGMEWDEFYAEIPQELTDLGLEFKRRFTLYVERVDYDLALAKTYSPLHIVLYAWNGTKDGIYYKVEGGFNHAVADGNSQTNYQEIFDSYSDYDNDPFVKKLSLDYLIGFPYIFIVVDNTPTHSMTIKENYLYKLVEGKEGKIALGINGKLMEGTKIDLWIEFEARNNGDIKGKIISVNLVDWNSATHIDMKGQVINK
jgi:hypothetical protein